MSPSSAIVIATRGNKYILIPLHFSNYHIEYCNKAYCHPIRVGSSPYCTPPSLEWAANIPPTPCLVRQSLSIGRMDFYPLHPYIRPIYSLCLYIRPQKKRSNQNLRKKIKTNPQKHRSSLKMQIQVENNKTLRKQRFDSSDLRPWPLVFGSTWLRLKAKQTKEEE